MPRPQLYINVHQTMLISVISIALLAYVFDFKGFRTSVNETYVKANNSTRR